MSFLRGLSFKKKMIKKSPECNCNLYNLLIQLNGSFEADRPITPHDWPRIALIVSKNYEGYMLHKPIVLYTALCCLDKAKNTISPGQKYVSSDISQIVSVYSQNSRIAVTTNYQLKGEVEHPENNIRFILSVNVKLSSFPGLKFPDDLPERFKSILGNLIKERVQDHIDHRSLSE